MIALNSEVCSYWSSKISPESRLSMGWCGVEQETYGALWAHYIDDKDTYYFKFDPKSGILLVAKSSSFTESKVVTIDSQMGLGPVASYDPTQPTYIFTWEDSLMEITMLPL